MKGKDLFNALSFVDTEIIEEANNINNKKIIPLKAIAVVAAGICALVSTALVSSYMINDRKTTNPNTNTTTTVAIAENKTEATTLPPNEDIVIPEIPQISYVIKNNEVIVAVAAPNNASSDDPIIETDKNSDVTRIVIGEVCLSQNLKLAMAKVKQDYRDNPEEAKKIKYLVGFDFCKRENTNAKLEAILGEDLRPFYNKLNNYDLIWVEGGSKTINGHTFIFGNEFFGLLTEEEINSLTIEAPYSMQLHLTRYETFEWRLPE